MTLLMTCWASFEPWMASGSIGRTPGEARRGIRLLPRLRAVARARLLAVADAGRIERSAHDLVADARQILHPAATDQDHRVLLEVEALARDVGGHLHPVRQPHARDLAQGRVRFLRRGRVHACAHPAA